MTEASESKITEPQPVPASTQQITTVDPEPEEKKELIEADLPIPDQLTPAKRTSSQMQTKLSLGNPNTLNPQKPSANASTPQHQFKIQAYALLRFHSHDVPLSSKEAFLGRAPITPTSTTPSVHIPISKCPKVSKTACRIYLDQETDLFACENLSKNAIMIDRQPVEKNQSRSLFHKTMIQIGDSICFFMLPNETQERKKRYLKERRKQLLDQIGQVHNVGGGPNSKNSGKKSQNESGPYPSGVSGLKGFGRRLNLKEMLMLHKFTREETRQQLGISFMPAGTKPTKSRD